MSYLDRLMARTGIDPGQERGHVSPTALMSMSAPGHTESLPLPPIVEIDVQNIVPAPITSSADQTRRMQVTEPRNVSAADHAQQATAMERIELLTKARAPTPDHMPVSAHASDESLHSASLSRPPGPGVPEIIIEPRRRVEDGVQIAPRIIHHPVREQAEENNHITASQTRPATTTNTPPAAHEYAQGSSRQPTFIEIRNWVASTPAIDEARPIESRPAKAEAPPTVPLERTTTAIATAAREDSFIHRAALERLSVAEAPQVELSIGTMHVIVEGPPTPVQPVRPQSPASRVGASSPSWSRLARRYIRT